MFTLFDNQLGLQFKASQTKPGNDLKHPLAAIQFLRA